MTTADVRFTNREHDLAVKTSLSLWRGGGPKLSTIRLPYGQQISKQCFGFHSNIYPAASNHSLLCLDKPLEDSIQEFTGLVQWGKQAYQ